MELENLGRTEQDIMRDALLARREIIDGLLAALAPAPRRGRPSTKRAPAAPDPVAAGKAALAAQRGGSRQRISPKGKRAIAEAQRRRWAEREQAKAAGSGQGSEHAES